MFFKKTIKLKSKLGSKNELSNSLESNIKIFDELFSQDNTYTKRFLQNQKNNSIKGYLIFFEGMVDNEIINNNIIQPFIQNTSLENNKLIDIIMNQIIASQKIKKVTELNELIEGLYNGDCILLLDKIEEFLIISSQGWQTRNIMEPETEKILRGPREGFTESLFDNLALIKRKLRTPDLKIVFKKLGRKTKTSISICYIDQIVNKKIVEEINRRIDNINIDGILDSGYIQELVRDSPYTPFPTMGSTEKPDVVAAKLLEGRIAVLVDGSPVAITAPYIFIEGFQSGDDYYISYFFASIGRILRVVGFFLTVSIPSVYMALVTFHQELIPTPLLFNISAAREGVPFPTIIELFVMLFAFEILRETGLRMPTFMGQALSIVGALVIGQAAVDARFVSAPMVIVVAFTGITGLMLPKLEGAIIYVRIIFILLSSILGLYGYIFGIAGLLIHLFELRSFGVSYMYRLSFLNTIEDIKDTAIRVPWWHIKYRPKLFSFNRVRNKTKRGNKSHE